MHGAGCVSAGSSASVGPSVGAGVVTGECVISAQGEHERWVLVLQETMVTDAAGRVLVFSSRFSLTHRII